MADRRLLERALADAIDRFERRNPRSCEAHARACEVLPGGNTRTVLFHAPFPLYMAGGAGCRLRDVDGHEYVDALGEFSAGLYGHSCEPIRRAIEAALASGLNLGAHTEAEARLARLIRERFPSMQRMRFTNSGTEANLMALVTARAATGRDTILVFDGAYHGSLLTFAGESPTTAPFRFVRAAYNDLAAAREVAERHAGALAAVLVEPMLGSGGCVPGEPAFLRGLQALAREHDALLVLDEVMTSRLDAGGLQRALGLEPDLTTLGKYFGGGLSFGAFGGREDLMARFDPRRPDALGHAGTFNNNVLSMAAGRAGLEQVLTAEALARLNATGDALRERLDAAARRRSLPLRASGIGSLMALHVAAERPRRWSRPSAVASEALGLVYFDLLERGVYMARRGYMALSLPFGEAEAGLLHAAFEDVLERRADVLAAALGAG